MATADIRFRVNQDKVLEALVFVAQSRPTIDVFHVCKVLYFADKKHLNAYGRPILGDKYLALDQGPVPSLVYDMIERDERYINTELLEKLSRSLSYYKSAKDDYLRITALRAPYDEIFSHSDIECLNDAIEKYADLEHKELIALVHAEPAYRAVYREGKKPSKIGYELFVEIENPLRDEIIKDMREYATFLLL
jgi:uncharacterized phage-associated protein